MSETTNTIKEINIKDITTGDTLKSLIDKVNYNFDQLVAHGGGEKGESGEDGAIAISGSTFGSNNLYYFDGTLSSDKINGSLYGINEGDYILLNDKKIYKYTSSDAELTPTNLNLNSTIASTGTNTTQQTQTSESNFSSKNFASYQTQTEKDNVTAVRLNDIESTGIRNKLLVGGITKGDYSSYNRAVAKYVYNGATPNSLGDIAFLDKALITFNNLYKNKGADQPSFGDGYSDFKLLYGPIDTNEEFNDLNYSLLFHNGLLINPKMNFDESTTNKIISYNGTNISSANLKSTILVRAYTSKRTIAKTGGTKDVKEGNIELQVRRDKTDCLDGSKIIKPKFSLIKLKGEDIEIKSSDNIIITSNNLELCQNDTFSKLRFDIINGFSRFKTNVNRLIFGIPDGATNLNAVTKSHNIPVTDINTILLTRNNQIFKTPNILTTSGESKIQQNVVPLSVYQTNKGENLNGLGENVIPSGKNYSVNNRLKYTSTKDGKTYNSFNTKNTPVFYNSIDNIIGYKPFSVTYDSIKSIAGALIKPEPTYDEKGNITNSADVNKFKPDSNSKVGDSSAINLFYDGELLHLYGYISGKNMAIKHSASREIDYYALTLPYFEIKCGVLYDGTPNESAIRTFFENCIFLRGSLNSESGTINNVTNNFIGNDYSTTEYGFPNKINVYPYYINNDSKYFGVFKFNSDIPIVIDNNQNNRVYYGGSVKQQNLNTQSYYVNNIYSGEQTLNVDLGINGQEKYIADYADNKIKDDNYNFARNLLDNCVYKIDLQYRVMF